MAQWCLGALLAAALAWPVWAGAQAVQTNLLSLNAAWRYNHTTCLDGVPWATTNYDDSVLNNWTNAAGGFTGGEANAAALVGVSTTTLPAPNSGTRAGRAMYFRTRFNAPFTSNLSLTFSNRIDDNAAFYLNGQLVQRVRLASNPILCTSFGDINPYTGSDAVEWDVFTLTPAQLAGILVAGTNTLAVEVHQNGSGSSDMVFAMSLTGTAPDTNPPPTLRMPTTLPAFGYTLVDAFPGANFSAPIAVTSPPGETNRLFVLERSGVVTVITNLAAPNRTPVMTVPGVLTDGENGLLGLAIHPGFATNGHFFLFYSVTASTAVPGGTNALHQRISRFTTTTPGGNTASAATELILLQQRDEANNHNGGDIHFGPDGYLYVTFGDEGNQNDSLNNSQTIRKDFFSGIVRLDVDKRPGNLEPNPHPSRNGATNYFVPADNPWLVSSFVGDVNASGTLRTEFYAVGLRNPWRVSFDPVTGWLWCGDVGGGAREEVDIIWKGGNYGWAFREGFIAGPKANSGAVTINPIIEYPHGSSGTNVGNSITGGVVYRGTRIPQLTGAYIYADFTSPGNMWAVRSTNGTNATAHQWLLQDANIVAFGHDPRNGDVLVVDIGRSQIQRLTYDTNTVVGTPLPPTLADTGAFTNLMALGSQTAALTPNAGMTAYDINTHFWSDNARKSRWSFLPGTNKFTFSPNANWSFPTGAAWVKHFDLELTNGVPSSARRLETRVLVKNAGGVYGVTYRWGDSLTNATLVGENGLDEAFTVYDGGIARTQIWRYPSRSECLTCHTPAGGLALGFNTAQLNRDYDYGAGPTNQLLAMSAAGRFSAPIGNVHSNRALAALDDESVSLEWRVRSYLAANCANCHVAGGSGLGSFTAAITNTTANAGLIHGTLANNGGNPNARVIVPGSPGDSMLLTRIATRGLGQMPPLASSVVDTQAVALVARWITNGLAGYQTFAQWQTNNFGSTNAPNALASADPDLDGASNHEEFITGTDPNQPGSFWAIGIQRSGGAVDVTWPRIPNRSVEIQWTTNLFNPASWQFLNVPANRPFYPAASGPASLPDSATGAPAKYYRARVSEP